MKKHVCPKCSSNELRVSVEMWADVTFYEEEDVDGADHEVTDGPYGDMEWDSDSAAQCRYCGLSGQLSDFAKEE